MAIKGLSTSDTFEVKILDDKEDPTTFICGFLELGLMMSLKDLANKQTIQPDGSIVKEFRENEVYYNLARHAIRDIKGLKDARGNPVKFETEAVFSFGKYRNCIKESILNMLTPSVLTEIGLSVYEKQHLTDIERKNLQEQSS